MDAVRQNYRMSAAIRPLARLVLPPLEGRLIRIPAADDGLGVVERQAYAPHLALEQVDGGHASDHESVAMLKSSLYRLTRAFARFRRRSST